MSRFLSVTAAAAIMAAQPAHAAEPTAPPSCTSAEYHQFDFWVGHWNAVDTKTHAPAGRSLIEKLYGGCTIRENWSEPGLTGGSLNSFSPIDHRWHQLWTDSSASWREFIGGLDDGHMILIWTHPSLREPGKSVRDRLTFTANADGTVRQQHDRAIDGGAWTELYDITYHRIR